MGHFLHLHPITITALLIFGLALMKGGAAERLGAALMIADWLLSLGSSLLAGQQIIEHVKIVPANLAVFIDFFFSLGLLALALRFAKLWLGMALLLQGMMLAVHALALSADAPGFIIYATFLNATTTLLLFSLLAGTLGAWRKRALRSRRASRAPSDVLPAPA